VHWLTKESRSGDQLYAEFRPMLLAYKTRMLSGDRGKAEDW
jgi:hypothetical protein